MTVGMSTTLRNSRLDQITANAGNAAKFQLMDGVRPATGGAATNKLAEFVGGTPFAAAAAAGVLTITLPAATVGLAAAGAGTDATWCRITTSGGTFVEDLSVSATGGGGDVQLTNVSIATGQAVTMTSATHTEGNP